MRGRRLSAEHAAHNLRHLRVSLLVLDRNGFLEEWYFDYAYTPIRGELVAVIASLARRGSGRKTPP